MIRDNVSYYTRLRGLTLGQLADRLNITRQTLHAQTTGPANIVSIEKIAAALQVEPWQLLHPNPASLETPPAPALICPICGARLHVSIQPAEQNQPGQAVTEGQTPPPFNPCPEDRDQTDSAGPHEDKHGQPAPVQEKRKRGRPRKTASQDNSNDGQLF